MRTSLSIINEILLKASDPHLDHATAQWIVNQEECTHIWRTQQMVDELIELKPNEIANGVRSAMSNLISILEHQAVKNNLPMLHKPKPQLIEKGDVELFHSPPITYLKDDALKAVEVQYIEDIGDKKFLANVLTFCFHVVNECGDEKRVLESVKIRDLGAALIPFMFVINPEVSLPATKCLAQVCGLGSYMPPLAMTEVLIAKATLIWFGNGSSQVSNEIGIEEYLSGKGRQLIDASADVSSVLGTRAKWIKGPSASSVASKYALIKSFDFPDWKPLLVAQQAYAQAALMILLQPEGFKSALILGAPSAPHALVNLCRVPASESSIIAKAAVVESLTMMMSFCSMLNPAALIHNWKLTALLTGLQTDNVGAEYFNQLCDLSTFLPDNLVSNLYPMILDVAENSNLRFDSRCRLVETFVRSVPRISISSTQVSDLLLRFQNDFTMLLESFADKYKFVLSTMGHIQTDFYLKLIHLHAEFFLELSESPAMNSAQWEQKMAESSMIQMLISALSNEEFVKEATPSCIRDMSKILSKLKINHHARLLYFDNSEFQDILKAGRTIVLNYLPCSQLYWEALWYLFSSKWPLKVSSVDPAPEFEIDIHGVEFDVDSFRKLLDSCMAKQCIDITTGNIKPLGRSIVTCFDKESLLKLMLWGQIVNQSCEELAKDVFMALVDLECRYCGTLDNGYLSRWIESLKLNENYVSRLFEICCSSASKALESLLKKLNPLEDTLLSEIQEAKNLLLKDQNPDLILKILKTRKVPNSSSVDNAQFDKLIRFIDQDMLKLLVLFALSKNSQEDTALISEILSFLSPSDSLLVALFIIEKSNDYPTSQRENLFLPFLRSWTIKDIEFDQQTSDLLLQFVEGILHCVQFDLDRPSPFIDTTLWSILEHFYGKLPKNSELYFKLTDASLKFKNLIFEKLGVGISDVCFNSQFGWQESLGKFLENEINSEDALAHPMRKSLDSVVDAFSRSAAENFHVQFSASFFDKVVDRIIEARDDDRYSWMHLLKVYCYYSDVPASMVKTTKEGIQKFCKLVYSKVFDGEWIHSTTFVCWRDLWLKEYRSANLKLMNDKLQNENNEHFFAMEPLDNPLNFLNVARIATNELSLDDRSFGGFRCLIWFNSMLISHSSEYARSFANSGMLFKFMNKLCGSKEISPLKAYNALSGISRALVRSDRLRAQFFRERIDCEMRFNSFDPEMLFESGYETLVQCDYDSVSFASKVARQSVAFRNGTLYPITTLEIVAKALESTSQEFSSRSSFSPSEYSDIPVSCLRQIVDSFSDVILNTTDSNKAYKQSDHKKALISLRCLVDMVQISSAVRTMLKPGIILRCFHLGSRYYSDDPRMNYTSAFPEISEHALELLSNLTRKSKFDPYTVDVRNELEATTEKVLLGMTITLEKLIPTLAENSLEQAAFVFSHCLHLLYVILENDEEDGWILWSMTSLPGGGSHESHTLILIRNFKIMELISKCFLLFDLNSHYMYIVRTWILKSFESFMHIQGLKVIPQLPTIRRQIEDGSLIRSRQRRDVPSDLNSNSSFDSEDSSAVSVNEDEDQENNIEGSMLNDAHAEMLRQMHSNRIQASTGNVFRNSVLGEYESNSSDFETDNYDDYSDDNDMSGISGVEEDDQNEVEGFSEGDNDNMEVEDLADEENFLAASYDSGDDSSNVDFEIELVIPRSNSGTDFSGYSDDEVSGSVHEFAVDIGPQLIHGEEELFQILAEVESEFENLGLAVNEHEYEQPPDLDYMEAALMTTPYYTKLITEPDNLAYSLADSPEFNYRWRTNESLISMIDNYAHTTPVNFDDLDVLNKLPGDIRDLDLTMNHIAHYKVVGKSISDPRSFALIKMAAALIRLSFSRLDKHRESIEIDDLLDMFVNSQNSKEIFIAMFNLLLEASAGNIEGVKTSLNSLAADLHGSVLEFEVGGLKLKRSVVLPSYTTAPLVISNLLTFLISALSPAHDEQPSEQLIIVAGEILSKFSNELVSLLDSPLILKSRALLERTCKLLSNLIPLNAAKFEPRLDAQSFSKLVNLLGSKESGSSVFTSITSLISKYLPDPEISAAIVSETRKSKKIITALLPPHDPESNAQVRPIRESDDVATEQIKILRLLSVIDKLFTGRKCLDILQKINLLPLWQASLLHISDMHKIPIVGTISALSILELIAIPSESIEREYVICEQEMSEKPEFSKYKEFYEQTTHFIRSKLSKFKTLINDLLHLKPKLVSGPVGELANKYGLLTFECKELRLAAALTEIKAGLKYEPGHVLDIDRSQVFKSSVSELMSLGTDELKQKLHIYFLNEPGEDGGGIAREWLELLSKEILSKKYELFSPTSAGSFIYQINPMSRTDDATLSLFRFVGRILGRLIYDQRTIGLHFSRTIYRYLLGCKVTLSDMEAVDEEYYKNLIWVLNNDISDYLEETFSVELEERGQKSIVDLIPQGRDISVTEKNKDEYVKLVVEFKLIKCVEKQLQAILSGFVDVVNVNLIKLFTASELELLISGLPNIDIEDWRRNSVYQGYSSSSEQVKWFWIAVGSFDDEQRAKLLQFCTGSSRVPARGFGKLESHGNSTKFLVTRENGDTDRLPSAHTCMNQINIPQYESYPKLRSLLLKAITEGYEGFGFA